MNYWDYHISNHETYIRSYGEGEGSPNRRTLFSFFDENDSVLDVGCGPGCNLGHARDIMGWDNFTYKGVDISPKFIEACKRLFPDGSFEVQDAENLREPDDSFDVVILQDVLEHLPGYRKAIAEAVRVARKRVVICLWTPLYDREDNIEDKGDGGYHSYYNKEKFMEFISQFGTVTTDEQHENRNHWYYAIEL